MAADFLTLMAPLGGHTTAKVVKADGQVQTPGQHVWHNAGQVQIDSFLRLAIVLTKASADPARRYYAVRGRVRAGQDLSRLRRKHVGEEASLEPAKHRWLLLDVDKFRPDLPPAEFAQDPGKYAAEARAQLPACFHEASCWWQATGGAGFKPGARLRMAFWLDRELDDLDVKKWAEGWALPVDLSLYTPSQPHYLAPPLFEPGAVDPVRVRCGVIRGQDTVTVDLGTSYGSGAADELAKAGRRVSRAKEGSRRNTLNAEAFKLARQFSEEELSAEEIKDTLLDAGRGSWDKMDGDKTVQTLIVAIREGRAKYAASREGWKKYLAQDKNGNPLPTAANVSLYLEYHPAFAGKLAWNERELNAYWIEPAPVGEPVKRKVSFETDAVYLVEWFQSQAHMVLKSKAPVSDGLAKACRINSFDPVAQYLDELPKWDGKPRLDRLFVDLLGVENTELNRVQTRIALVQAVRRAYATAEEPVKADHVLVLVGEQGTGKSSVLSLLCPLPRFFVDSLPPLNSKDTAQVLADSWIVELGEMTQRKADQDLFKNFISRTTDKLRLPYGRDVLEVPRRCALFGTTNDDQFLTDTTGNRRFWPLLVEGRLSPAGRAWLAQNRDQIWAEAKELAPSQALFLPPELEAQAALAQARFEQEDQYEDKIQDLLTKTGSGMSGTELEPGQLNETKHFIWVRTRQLLDMLGARWEPREQRRVTTCLKRLGWRQTQVNRQRAWRPPQGWIYQSENRSLN